MREFLIEIGTIIRGILIALGFEQVVEAVHWNLQIDVAEESILPEVRANLLNAYERVVHIRCTSNRVQELRDLLLKNGSEWKAVPGLLFQPIGRW